MALSSRIQYSILIIALAILFSLHYTFFLGLLIVVGVVFGRALLPNKPSLQQMGLGTLFAILAYPICITPLYWFLGYHAWYGYAVTILLSLIALCIVPRIHLPQLTLHFQYANIKIGTFIAAASLLLPLFVLSQKQIGDTIYSPWTYIGPRFWIAITIGGALALMIHKKATYTAKYILLTLWYAIVLLVIFFVYKHAFGFDQHIHLTAMRHIIEFGTLTPKVPYYLGQYFIAIPFADITGLSLDWISRALVPVGATLTLPLLLLSGEKKQVTTHLFFLPLLPLSFFTFTTPNNLALLTALLTILWVWNEWQEQTIGSYIITIVLIACTLITHVMIGLPLALVVLSFYLKKYAWLPLIGVILGIPLLLLLFGGATVAFEPTRLLAIFKEPHWFIGETNSLYWQALYQYRALIPLVCMTIVAIAYWSLRGVERQKKLAAAILSMSLLFLFSILFLSFPNLLAYEQGVYASRMFELLTILCIPFFITGLSIITKKRLLLIPLFLLLLCSIYFTYPTRDAISYYTGVSIRDADIEAIKFIESQATSEPYIVLTNQSIGAAAMATFGFDHYIDTTGGTPEYFYSIPTGGPLYRYFRDYIYNGHNRDSIEAAMEFAKVEKAYLIHTNYWAPAAEIRDASKVIADNWWEVGDGRVWIFEFNL